MQLVRARVTNYKSIDDSGWVSMDGVTCLVGKNESGKTAFLQALRRLNPVPGANGDFDLKDYPRKGYARYKRIHPKRPAIVVSAEFELADQEVDDIGVLASSKIVVHKDYANRLTWNLDFGEPPQGAADRRAVEEHLQTILPRFVYFDDYSSMRGRIAIEDMLERRSGKGELDDADRTFLSLLETAGVELEDLRMQTNYEHLKAELESAAIGISDAMFEYWQQNKQLRVDFDMSLANPDDPPPLNSGTILHVRVWNDRHRVSVSFDERSKGFVWFFSFLTYFSNLEEESLDNLILLLDEPGINLHAMAQTDFLRFMEERLLRRHQVVYSTHSPFMVDLKRLDRVRMVEDLDGAGTVISEDVLSNDRETVFPLQVGLGYHMAERLFRAPHVLMVNSPSDLIYLQVLGDVAASTVGARLDPRWVLIPVGGAENVPTFISLLDEDHVTVGVLMDITPTKRDRIERITDRSNPIKWVEVTRIRDADLEDLFDPSFFLDLVNRAYADELPANLTLKSISSSNPRIAARVASYFRSTGIADGNFDRNRPAAYLLGEHAHLRNGIDDSTIERAAALFDRINKLLPSNASNGAVSDHISLNRARVVA